MKTPSTKRTAHRDGSREGFEVSIRGLRISLGKSGAIIIAAGVAGILYAVARGF